MEQKYYADNVDIEGNVFPTVGENIRRGKKEGVGVDYEILAKLFPNGFYGVTIDDMKLNADGYKHKLSKPFRHYNITIITPEQIEAGTKIYEKSGSIKRMTVVTDRAYESNEKVVLYSIWFCPVVNTDGAIKELFSVSSYLYDADGNPRLYSDLDLLFTDTPEFYMTK